MKEKKTLFSKKAQNELKRRREIRELEFKLFGATRLKNLINK